MSHATVATVNSNYSVDGIETLEIVLKTVERCNINCSYCYFFNGGDESYKQHSPYISRDTIQAIAKFVARGAEDLGISTVRIDLHGGEPLMQKRKDFDFMCNTFYSILGDSVKNVSLSVQSNGMLINEDWIALCEKHHVGLGISIDGPEKVHDEFRIDHLKRGTYSRVVAGLEIAQQAVKDGRLPDTGILCVINPSQSAKDLYHHFVHELGITNLDFLLPDLNHDSFKDEAAQPEDYGRYLCELFDAWTEQDDVNIRVRILNNFIARLFGSTNFQFGYSREQLSAQVITISSDGDVAPDDTLRTTGLWDTIQTPNVRQSSLRQVLDGPIYHLLENARQNPPAACLECCWVNICGGGHPTNRYSSSGGLNNRTIYCEGLKDFYSHVTAYLLRNGLGFERLKKALQLH